MEVQRLLKEGANRGSKIELCVFAACTGKQDF